MLEKRNSIVILLIGLALSWIVISCATMNVTLTPKKAAAWMNNIYAAQYDEYLTWFNVVGQDANNKPIYELKPNVPEKQKEILRTKKKIFIELQPLLNSYSAYAASGISTPLMGEVVSRATVLVQQLVEMKGGE